MKPRVFQFSILTRLLLTAAIARGLMLYQRHVAWLAAEARFYEIIASDNVGEASATKGVQSLTSCSRLLGGNEMKRVICSMIGQSTMMRQLGSGRLKYFQS